MSASIFLQGDICVGRQPYLCSAYADGTYGHPHLDREYLDKAETMRAPWAAPRVAVIKIFPKH